MAPVAESRAADARSAVAPAGAAPFTRAVTSVISASWSTVKFGQARSSARVGA